MVRSLIHGSLSRMERRLGASLEYVRFIADTSLRAFYRLTKLLSFSQCRRKLPPDVFHAAGLVATRIEDCGTCLQIGANLAMQEGMPAQHVRAVIEGKPELLPEHLAQVYRFAQAVLERGDDARDLRDALRCRYGDEGLIELAYSLAAARTFPTIKWALGYAVSCDRVPVTIP